MFKKTLALAIAASVLLTGCYETGAGKKVGMITKVAQEGLVCKTFEASIQRGGFNGGTGVNGQAFNFTIESPELAKKAEDLMNRQVEVEITYSSELVSFCRSEHGSHFLKDIKEIHNGPEIKVPQQVQSDNNQKPEQVQQQTRSSDDKIIQLMQVQSQLLGELIKERQQGK